MSYPLRISNFFSSVGSPLTREQFICEWRRRGGNHCFYCGAEFGLPGTLMAVSEEHVYPKHKYHLVHNTVKACRGCNFAKNGFMPNEFREWMGEEFYAEWLLGERLPPIPGTLLYELYQIIDKHFDAEISRILGPYAFGGRRLTLKLRNITREATRKSKIRAQYPVSAPSVSSPAGNPVRESRTSQNVPQNKS
jgi:hypothetical protein